MTREIFFKLLWSIYKISFIFLLHWFSSTMLHGNVIWSTSNLLPELILWQPISSIPNNLLYLFLNCIIDRLIKPHLTEDERGPWEIIWNRFVDIFGEDRYKYYVWGKNYCITIPSTKNSLYKIIPREYEKPHYTFSFLLGSLLVSTIFYWMSAGIYAIMDFTQRPKFLMKYKIQPDKNVPLDTKKFMKVANI